MFEDWETRQMQVEHGVIGGLCGIWSRVIEFEPNKKGD